ncbi:MAG: hypothetical protein Q8Q01_05130 [archaeon]|nr:hypothetical protein [archaeon]
MAFARKLSAEYKEYHHLKLWKANPKILLPEELIQKKSPFFPLFSYLYQITRETYAQLPLRKNGEPSFLHPINTVLALKQAGITDEITLCIGIIHDLVEEKVDLYKKGKKINKIKNLDRYEEELFEELEEELFDFVRNETNLKEAVKIIISVTKLLTRHKRDFYLRSIGQIFRSTDDDIKEIAIRVKLADRMHNILTLEKHDNEKRIYSCFKSLFILNNTKQYILHKYGKHMVHSRSLNPTELLFKRCAKATYEAHLIISDRCLSKGIEDTKTMIQLAFKKYAMEKEAVWQVTNRNPKEKHLMNIFDGIVRKYNLRLHHKWHDFEKRKKEEYEYAKRFFADFSFNDEQIQAIVNYKDSYGLKEVIAHLLYVPDYVIGRFLVNDLTENGRLPR